MYCQRKVYFYLFAVYLSFLFTSLNAFHYPAALELKKAGQTDIEGIAWSPDGRYLASFVAERSPCKVWDTYTGRLARSLEVSARVTAFAWGPNYHLALGFENGTIEVWDIATGSIKARVDEGARISLLAWSADGRFIASLAKNFTGISQPYANESTICLWDVASRSCVGSYGFNKHVSMLKWAPFGLNLGIALREVSGSAHEVQILTFEEKGDGIHYQQANRYTETAEVYSLVWSPCQNRLAVSLEDGTVAVYDNTQSVCVRRWKARELARIVGEISWSADGKYIIAGGINQIEVWDSHTGQLRHEVSSLKNIESLLLSIQDSPFISGEDTPFAVAKVVWAPHNAFIAAGIRSQYNIASMHCHALILFEAHKLYAGLKSILQRELSTHLKREEALFMMHQRAQGEAACKRLGTPEHKEPEYKRAKVTEQETEALDQALDY